MASELEPTGALERRLSLTVSLADVADEVERKLREMARTARMPGFRPGKVPLNVLAQTYRPKLHAETLSDQVQRTFAQQIEQANLRMAGSPRIEPAAESVEGQAVFTAVFEVYPEIQLKDPAALQVERTECAVTEDDIDRTLNVLRRQHVSWQLPADGMVHAAAAGDRITLDFVGTLDGVVFEGGSAQAFTFVLGEGRMLPDFEAGVIGLTVGKPHCFEVAFPENYGAPALAGKTASFEVTVKSIELAQLPEIDESFIQKMGVGEGTLAALREEIRVNLERQVAQRVKERTKRSVISALPKLADFELPAVLVQRDAERVLENIAAEIAKQGRNKKDLSWSLQDVLPAAQNRVRLGLLSEQVIRTHGLQAKPDQVRQYIEETVRGVAQPGEWMRQVLGDTQRMRELEAMVTEQNLVDWVLAHAQVTDRALTFNELMAGDGVTEGAAA